MINATNRTSVDYHPVARSVDSIAWPLAFLTPKPWLWSGLRGPRSPCGLAIFVGQYAPTVADGTFA